MRVVVFDPIVLKPCFMIKVVCFTFQDSVLSLIFALAKNTPATKPKTKRKTEDSG